ncbi:MAG: UDP-N-acetylmuramate dehydrogenase [Filifactoraceae bacterium]
MERTSLEKLEQELKDIVGKDSIVCNDLMKNHTSFRIGGPADFIVMPKTIDEIVSLIKYLKHSNTPFIVMGNGSNLLVRDKGIRGIVIKISDNFRKHRIEGNKVICESGILLSTIARKIAEAELKGFEFASGIPGTIGGGTAMNAGAYGGEMKDIITRVKCIDENGTILEFTNEEMEFEYRNSKVIKDNLIVLEVEMEFEKGSYEEIRSITNEFTFRRRTKQPLSSYSAGSTFKRPVGYYAGKLIEDSGLKGVAFGDAMVSNIHSGFVINKEAATCEEMVEFLGFIKKTVYDKYNVLLEEEVKIIGEV